MPRPFCLHIGVPKTATTTLQMALFPSHPHIRYFGKPYWDEAAGWEQSHAVAQLVDMIWQKDSLQYDPEIARELYERGIVPRLDETSRPVLSEEALSQASGADRNIIAQRLKSVFGADCTIFITIRNQIKALESGYLWCSARRILDVSFDRWTADCLGKSLYRQCIDDWPQRQFRYDELVKLYHSVFGKEKVAVLMHEELVRYPETFLSKFAHILDVNEEGFEKNFGKAVFNPSLSRPALVYQRTVKHLKRTAAGIFGVDANPDALLDSGIHEEAMRLFGRFGKARVTMSDSTRQMLREYYAPSNNRLSEMCDLPLKEYGYPL